jgi:hypothetical protein
VAGIAWLSGDRNGAGPARSGWRWSRSVGKTGLRGEPQWTEPLGVRSNRHAKKHTETGVTVSKPRPFDRPPYAERSSFRAASEYPVAPVSFSPSYAARPSFAALAARALAASSILAAPSLVPGSLGRARLYHGGCVRGDRRIREQLHLQFDYLLSRQPLVPQGLA